MTEILTDAEDEIYGSDNALPENLANELKLRHLEQTRADIKLAAIFGSVGLASAFAGVIASLYRPKHI